MKSTFEQLGKYVRLVDERNTEMITENVLGINIDKYFMPSVANVIGTDLENYKLLRKGRFACNPMHVGRDGRLPVARYAEETPAIVSPAYFMFDIKDENEIEPEYLMICFHRPDFDRMCWFRTDASVRGGITWEDVCALTIPVPPISEQRKIVREYRAITDRIELLQKMIVNIDSNNETRLEKMLTDAEHSETKEMIRIGDHVVITRGVSFSPEETTDKPTNGYLPILRANNIVEGNLIYDDVIYVLEKNVSSDQHVTNRSMIIAMSSGSQAHVGKVAMAYGNLPYSYGAFCAKITIDEEFEGLISTFLKGRWFKTRLEQVLLGTTINNIKREDIEGIEIPVICIALNEFEKEYQALSSYKAYIVQELIVLRELQKKAIQRISHIR